jgi:hypothetical protein
LHEKYRFAFPATLLYPDVLIPGEGSLIAYPGRVIDFPPPADGRWVRVEATPAKSVKKESAD